MSNDPKQQANSAMWIHEALGTKLISASTAVEIARLVTLDRHGQSEVDRNTPFSVTASGDTWVVTGTHSEGPPDSQPLLPDWIGPLRMKISSFDGRIFEYRFDPILPWLKIDRPNSENG